METVTNLERARILTEALPYIQRYNGKIVVVKYGGNAMISEELRQQVAEDIVLLNAVGVKVVLVHGGGPEINELLRRLGKRSEFVNGLRVTDAETMEAVEMTLAGKVNKNLVTLLNVRGWRAVGLSGMDGGLIQARQKSPVLGYVGSVTGIDARPVTDLLALGYIPVISTIGCGPDGQLYNINGDTAAAHIAGALGAERLFMMTDVPGVLRDKDDASTLIRHLTVSEAVALFEQNVIAGGMIPKVECCIEAIQYGVKRVVILDGRVPHSILAEMLTDAGAGTMVEGDENNG
ncbi:MAG: acetylglutamate kinase [Oscillospiraceae bacterium]|nr:acetylglutamate kinase [Oscillospiraceae bacterium]